MAKTSAKKTTTDFESDLKELETLVEKMESGEQSLDESLATFERGIQLTRQCQQALQNAEQRVQILLEKNGVDTLSDFDGGSDKE